MQYQRSNYATSLASTKPRVKAKYRWKAFDRSRCSCARSSFGKVMARASAGLVNMSRMRAKGIECTGDTMAETAKCITWLATAFFEDKTGFFFNDYNSTRQRLI